METISLVEAANQVLNQAENLGNFTEYFEQIAENWDCSTSIEHISGTHADCISLSLYTVKDNVTDTSKCEWGASIAQKFGSVLVQTENNSLIMLDGIHVRDSFVESSSNKVIHFSSSENPSEHVSIILTKEQIAILRHLIHDEG